MLERLAFAAGAFLQAARVSVRAQADTAAAPARSAYQGAGQGRLVRGWFSPSTGPNAAVMGSLSTLRNRSREQARNGGYGRAIIGKTVANLVGTGIKPLSQITDPKLRALVQERWLRWTDESDPEGQLDFYGQQSQAARGWMEGGEQFIRLRPRNPEDGLTVPLQLQVLEPEMVPHDYTTTAANGNPVRMGIEYNRIGGRAAYYFYRTHPGDGVLSTSVDSGLLVRVPATSVIHLYDPLRAGQLRGVPILAPILTDLWQIGNLRNATLVRQHLSNMFMGFHKRAPGPIGGSIDPLTGRATELDAQDRPLVAVEPGTIQELEANESLEWSEPPEVGTEFGAFLKSMLQEVALGVEQPYEIMTGDLSAVNDRTARLIVNEFRRRIEQWQYHVLCFQLCRRVWLAWWDAAILTAGVLPISADDYQRNLPTYTAADWTPDRWPYLNPVQDIQAERDEIRAGMKSRRRALSERGYDIEAVDAEIAADNKRADTEGLVFDTDPRKVARTGVVQQGDPTAADADTGGAA